MKKILLSIAGLALVGAVVVGATGAFYGDTETSTGNTFTAGAVDLKVDSVSHYNGMVCTDVGGGIYQWLPEDPQDPADYPVTGSPCDGTWSETDLQDGVHKFFNFEDVKPGDWGEDTISLHVYGNDAWGQFEISPTADTDNGCTEPEQVAENNNCSEDGDGEIDDNLRFTVWLDQGSTPGFQCGNPRLDDTGAECSQDPNEGDNIPQPSEPVIWDDTLIGDLGPFDLSEVFSRAYQKYCLDNGNVNGQNGYEYCQGLARDGRMVASTTYYFGVAWNVDLDSAGNEIQTDSYTADLTFRVEQRRNNPNPFGGDLD